VAQVREIAVGHYDRCDPDGYIDIEDRFPAEVVCEDAAEGRAEGGTHDVAESPPADGGTASFGGKAFAEDGAWGGSDGAAAACLDHPGDNQEGEVVGQAAQQRTDRKDGNTAYVKIEIADPGLQPGDK